MNNLEHNINTMEEFFTRSEAAKYFKVHPRTIERWLRNGNLNGYKLGKSKTSPWRISKVEIEEFLKRNKI